MQANKEAHNMQSTLVLQSFGRENEYKRAILTVFSFYAYVSNTGTNKVLLFTDNPGYFDEYFTGLPVEYVLLTPEKIKVMRGEIDFLHRMKIALIEEAFSLAEGNLIYADSDTFFIADPTEVSRQLTPEKSFMHVWEYQFKIMKDWGLPAGETFQAFYRLITSQSFMLSKGERIDVTPEMSSWNAGVMMFHPEHAKYIADVYTLTDQFYPPTLNHASEQYAFSVVLQTNTDLQRCYEVNYHYWNRVQKQVVDLFLAEKLTADWSRQTLQQKITIVKEWTRILPTHLQQHILIVQDKAIQAFNQNRFGRGYQFAAKSILKKPFDQRFLKDVLYHTKRRLWKS